MEIENHEKKWLTAEEACAHLRISRRTLSRLMSSGRISYAKPGGHLRFKVAWLDRFVEGPCVDAPRGPGRVRAFGSIKAR